MDRRNTCGFLAVLLFELLAGNALANGFRLADQDAFATARGEAFVATADNPSAVYYNPAGIAQLEGLDVRGGLYGICYDTSYRPPGNLPNAGKEYHSLDDCAVVPEFFGTYTPKDQQFTFGLGLYAPYGGSLRWPETTGFRSVGIKSSLTYLTFNPVLAMKVLPSLSLGAGIMANYGAIQLDQGLVANPTPFYNFFRFKGCGWAVSYNGGILWQPLNQLSFGATIRSPATFDMEGKTEFVSPPNIPNAQTHTAHGYFKFPLTTTFGVSYRPTPKWNLEFDADYTDWSSFGTVTIYQTVPPVLPNGIKRNIPVTLKWRASWMYEFGVTRYFDNGWHVSTGYVFNESSVPDTYYTPLVADMDRHFISAGFGHKGKRLNFDVAYQFGYGPPHTVTGSLPSSLPGNFSGQRANGTYEFISHAVLISAGLNF